MSATLFFVISSKLSTERPRVDVPDVSLEARPAVNIVNSCLESVATDALDKLGKQGGMMNSPEISYPSYRGEAVLDGPNTIPFWRYLDDCDNPNGCEIIKVSPLCKSGECYGLSTGSNSIQEQLETYVMKNIDSCIDEFSSIRAAYNVEKNGEPSVEVIFKEEKTDFILHYPLIITSLTTDNTVTYDSYVSEIDIDFLGMYTMAEDILSFERETNYYERQTMNLVNIYSGLDSNLLPPTSEVGFQFRSFVPWISYDVKENLKYDLLPFMNLITFPNANNFVYIKDPKVENADDEYISKGIYSSFNPKISNSVYPFDVTTQYNYDEIFLKINDGEVVIKPTNMLDSDDSLLAKLSQLAIQDYRFKYDISYPLIITISDPFAKNFLGYDFKFAIEVNIRNNVPAYQNFTRINLEPVKEAIGLADFQQRLPQNITIKTIDKLTNEPLSDVIISYVCAKDYAIGMTEYDYSGDASLITNFPYCEMGGFIKYSREGYFGESIPFNNKLGGISKEVILELWPEQEKKILIKKRTVEDLEKIKNAGTNALELYDSSAENISANQTAFINIERIATSPYDGMVPLPGFLSIEGEGTDYSNIYINELNEINRNFELGYYNKSTRDKLELMLKEQNAVSIAYDGSKKELSLKFVPGNYTLDGSLIDKTGFTIPEMSYTDYTEVTSGKEALTEKLVNSLILKTDDFMLPEQNFTSWMVGGVKINFTLTPAEVYNNKTLIIYVLEQEIPSSWPDLNDLETIEEYQKGKEYFVNPYVW